MGLKATGSMDPNSQHQIWSLWTFIVTPGMVMERPFRDVKYNLSRFARNAFGSTSQINIVWDGKSYVIKIRSEGHPAHDPSYQKYFLENFTKFFVNGFGLGTSVNMLVKVEAGDKQDGKPAEQLIILPSINLRCGA